MSRDIQKEGSGDKNEGHDDSDEQWAPTHDSSVGLTDWEFASDVVRGAVGCAKAAGLQFDVATLAVRRGGHRNDDDQPTGAVVEGVDRDHDGRAAELRFSDDRVA